MNTRKIFIDTLTELAKNDPKIILIVGDVGFSYIEDFGAQFPNQFINVGVTEQSMMGIAAGMALSGWKPYVYSMIPFVTMRCYEQLRNDVCYHNANVKVIGVQGSVHYKFLGFSHNIVDVGNEKVEWEDEAIVAHLPNMDFWIANPINTESIIKLTYSSNKPTYIRL